MRPAKSCSRLVAPLCCCVHPAHGVQSGPGGHATHEPSRVNTQASVLRWWLGGEAGSSARVASGAAATAQPPSFALGSFLPVGCQPGRVGLVLAMSFERTGLPCADPLSRPLSLTVGEVRLHSGVQGAWSL
jgi:hypothetical protein